MAGVSIIVRIGIVMKITTVIMDMVMNIVVIAMVIAMVMGMVIITNTTDTTAVTRDVAVMVVAHGEADGRR